MQKLVTVTALALFGLAPAIGSACEYNQAMASSAQEQLGLAPAPAATKAPVVAKAAVAKPQKQAAKDKAPAQDPKLVAVSRN